MPSVADDESIRLELAADLANVSAARRFVRQRLEGRVPADVSADLQLATSELVTNAIEHGATGPVVVLIAPSATRTSITVVSHGQAADVSDDPDAWHVAEPEQIFGRGLGIVRELADDVTVAKSTDGLTVTVSRTFQPVC